MAAVEGLAFLSKQQEDEIFYLHAEHFFAREKNWK
jgi:hypothetical protein